jgi:hypothetical protein
VKTLTATIGANTLISKVASATNADVTAGNVVVVDLGREATAAKSVLIVKQRTHLVFARRRWWSSCQRRCCA